MLDLQVPLLAAKALLLLLLFAFIYAVVRRGIGDLLSVPDDEAFVPGKPDARSERAGTRSKTRVETNSGVRQEVRSGAPQRASSGSPQEGRNGYSTLVVEDSDILAPSTRFRLASDTTSIGRSGASDIVLKSDDFVSGQHAKLTRHGGLLYVEDANSTNGTYVNERKAIGATPLRSGDRVRVGSTTFRYSE